MSAPNTVMHENLFTSYNLCDTNLHSEDQTLQLIKTVGSFYFWLGFDLLSLRLD